MKPLPSTIHDAAAQCRRDFESLWAANCHQTDNDWLQQRIMDFWCWAADNAVDSSTKHIFLDKEPHTRPRHLRLDGMLYTRPQHRDCIVRLLRLLHRHLAQLTDCWATADDSCSFTAAQDGPLKHAVEIALDGILKLTRSAIVDLGHSPLWLPALELDQILDLEDSEETRALASHMSGCWAQSNAQGTDDLVEIRARLEETNHHRQRRFLAGQRIWSHQVRALPLDDPAELSVEWSHHSSEPQIPPPPKVSPDSMSFVCPFCWHEVPTFFAEPAAWRVHFLADLSPYSCIMPDCQESRGSARPLVFASDTSWKSHMHGHRRNEAQRTPEDKFRPPSANSQYKSSAKIMATEPELRCPLCLDDGSPENIDNFLDHVSLCLVSFAMKSIPHRWKLRATHGHAEAPSKLPLIPAIVAMVPTTPAPSGKLKRSKSDASVSRTAPSRRKSLLLSPDQNLPRRRDNRRRASQARSTPRSKRSASRASFNSTIMATLGSSEKADPEPRGHRSDLTAESHTFELSDDQITQLAGWQTLMSKSERDLKTWQKERDMLRSVERVDSVLSDENLPLGQQQGQRPAWEPLKFQTFIPNTRRAELDLILGHPYPQQMSEELLSPAKSISHC